MTPSAARATQAIPTRRTLMFFHPYLKVDLTDTAMSRSLLTLAKTTLPDMDAIWRVSPVQETI
jgi:hypothetical protein